MTGFFRAFFAAAAGTVLLAGCAGFTPLYGTGGVAPQLSAIDIRAPQGRTGHFLREELEDQLARDRDAAPLYRLDLRLDESRYARGLSISDVATRYEYAARITYALVDSRTGRTLTRGFVRPIVTYDAAGAPYAGVAAQLDAQERAATEGARLNRLDLARWFAGRGRTPA